MSPARSQGTPSRYVVGIDLGTTNSAVTYVDTDEEPWRVRTLSACPAGRARGRSKPARRCLRFTIRRPTPRSLPRRVAAALDDATRPADHCASASSPATRARRCPGRLIASAKSWLCHSGVDRTAELLPWHGAADVERLSPVEVDARDLRTCPRRLGRAIPAAPAGRAGHRAHAAGLVRRSGPRADRQGGRPGRAAARGADRRAAGGLLRLGRQHARRLARRRSSRARRSWSATSAAAPPTSR